MATTLEVIESAPAAFPEIPNLAEGIEVATVWARIDGWINARWGERECAFIVEGPGHWRAPLYPFIVATIEIWDASEWVSAVIAPSALAGYQLEGVGPYRFMGILGDAADPPAIVLEAARRLGAYLVAAASRQFENAILTKESSDEIDSFEYAPPANAAKALQYSGAADLLRRFRRPPGASPSGCGGTSSAGGFVGGQWGTNQW